MTEPDRPAHRPHWQRLPFVGMDSAEVSRIIRFAGNGLFNTALSYVLFVVMVAMGMTVFGSLLVSTSAAIIINFQTSRRLVFQSKTPGLMFRFCLVYVALFAFNYTVLLGLKACGMPSWLAQATLLVPIAALAYVAQRNLIFNRSVV